MAASPYNATTLTPSAPSSKLNGLTLPAFAAGRTVRPALSSKLNALTLPAFAAGRTIRSALVRNMPLNAVGVADLTLDAGATLSGAVTDNTVPVPYARVKLYRRTLGILIDQQVCSASGAFTFSNLPTTNPQDYFVVAFDLPGGTVYNALILDYLSPA